jgi:hypothetical protein
MAAVLPVLRTSAEDKETNQQAKSAGLQLSPRTPSTELEAARVDPENGKQAELMRQHVVKGVAAALFDKYWPRDARRRLS